MKIEKYPGNPILSPNPHVSWESRCVLNPAVVFDEKTNLYWMFYRAAGEDLTHIIQLGLALSQDGIHFTRDSENPIFPAILEDPDGASIEDPRIWKMGDAYFMSYAAKPFPVGRYWLSWEERSKNEKKPEPEPLDAPEFMKRNLTVTYLAYSRDLRRWKRCGRITNSYYDDRDVVVFPRKIGGKYIKLCRPRFNGWDSPPYIWMAEGEDILEYGNPHLFYEGREDWEKERVGCGCPPLETEEGWLLLYHGVSYADSRYRVGLMLLDREHPNKILYKTKKPILEPNEPYEMKGIYPGCVFPTGWVLKGDLLNIYYGCSDSYVALAQASLSDILQSLKKEPYEGGE